MSSSFSDLSEEVRFVMHKTLSQPESMNNPSKSPVPADESSSTKEPDDSEVQSSEGMAELPLKYIRHTFESFHCHRKVILLSIVF